MSKPVIAVKLNSFHRTKADTAALKKGTIMFHYALTGDKDEIAKYTEARGANLREVEEGEHKGKPMWFTSQILADTVEVRINAEGNINVYETIEEATEKAKQAKQQILSDKEMEKKFQLAAKYGVTLA